MVNFITNIKIAIVLFIEKYLSFLRMMKKDKGHPITYSDNEKRNNYGYPIKKRIVIKNHKFNKL